MKRSVLLLIILLASLWIDGYSQIKVCGKLLNNKNERIEFANIAFKSAEHFFGVASDEQGQFELQVSPGNYQMKISVIGYNSYEKEISIDADIDLGEIRIAERAVQMGEVVVKANRVVREADRFIVHLANDPTIFGKSGSDMLALSPGVFVQERDGVISINGKSGTRVYVNERPMHESGADLIRYLQMLKAEDIQRIEVVPVAGAGYDADMQGGIIKITLKRQREDGVYGHAGASYSFAPGKDVSSFNPSFNINYKNKKLSLYSQLSYDDNRAFESGHEIVRTSSLDREVTSDIELPTRKRNGRVRLGGVYELDNRQSIGLEGTYYRNARKNKTNSEATEITAGNQTDVLGRYHGKNVSNNYAASANYMLQLDSLGSLFKILLDYHHKEADDNQNYNSHYHGYMNFDTVYRSDMFTRNDLYAINMDFNFRLKKNTTFATGLKYTRNEMENQIIYEYDNMGNWHEIDLYSSESKYAEDIAAVYASFSSQLKKLSYSIGLRGEYTHASPWTNKSDETKEQDYFELFPTVNVMLPFGKKNNHSFVLNYNRKINRPSFNNLNPYRVPASEYLFIEGNPDLKAALSNDYSIALRLFNRYNLVAGVTDTKKAFGMVLTEDPNTPGVLIQRQDNVARNTNYYLAANTSLSPVKWWRINLNLSGRRNEIDVLDEKHTQYTFQGYMAFLFSLPKDFQLDVNGFYSSPFIDGNVKTKIDPRINASLRKEFFNRKLTAKLFVNNLFNMTGVEVKTREKDFQRTMNVNYGFREFGLSLSYNFKMGKNVKVKNVQIGAQEDRSRLQ